MGNVIEVVAAVVRRKGRVLIASRKQEGWEFPGGKIEPGETRAAALRRELEEELSIRNALVLDELFQICRAVGPDRTVHLHFLRTMLPDDAEIIPREGQQVRWVEPEELFHCGLLPADRPLADFLNPGSRMRNDGKREPAPRP